MCNLKESMNILVFFGCSVWCQLFGCMYFGFFLGSMVMYLCMSHSISVSKSCGGGCRKLVRCRGLSWEKCFHNLCNFSVVKVVMYFPF